MVQTDIDICNLAIGRVGGETIDAFDESSPAADFCAVNYAQKRDWLLSKHRWVFAAALAQLAQRTVTPQGCPLPFAYDGPSDLVGAVFAYRTGPDAHAPRVHALPMNGYVAAGQAPVWIEYTRRVPEAQWPPWFTELVVTAFAADLAVGVAQSNSLAVQLRTVAFGDPRMEGDGGLLLQAKTEDGRGAPQRNLCGWDDGVLVGARFAYGPYGSGNGYGFGGYGGDGSGVPYMLTFLDFN